MDWTALTFLLALLIGAAIVWVKTAKRKEPKNQSIYNGSEQDERHLKQIYVRASTAIVDEKLYLRKNIRLGDLAVHLNQNEKLVSRAINKFTNLNFNTYINTFRVEYSMEMISGGSFDHYTIEAIAHESGFSNKVSFYQAFKSNQGVSPTEFKAQKQLKK